MKTKTFIGLVLVAVWGAMSYKMMWFPVCQQVGGSANACVNNLRQIEGAKKEYALETGRTNGPVDVAAINRYLGREGREVTCESGGTYTYRDLGQVPVCSVTNSLPGVKERVGLFGWRWKVKPSPGPHRLPY
jgi:hypothetical protein